MTTFTDILFYINLAWIMTHELDAVAHHEWRLLQFNRIMSDKTAFQVFTLLHIPLFAVIMWYAPVQGFQIGFDIFLILHWGAHWILRNLEGNTFNNWMSQLIIAGSAISGAIHLMMLLV